ncbi:endoglucanase [Desulfonema ishimotonii]|uniref:Endoglucanase n=1 Tax=Desulfonema ishimotonii TaxID=45657 RepID=A0A401FU72_9BACT|nr:glycosyl hydrolase [Desulfonema ishimotonii]GBC60519.1 endoglucanase [Desulfonema ishimotonii]
MENSREKTVKVSVIFRRMVMAAICSIFLLCPSLSSATLLGVYYGNQGWKMDEVRDMETWQGKKNAVLNLFTSWKDDSMDHLFDDQLPNIWENENVPLITWEPFTGSDTPDDIENRIASGEFDTYIGEWADQMAVFLNGPDTAAGTEDDRQAYIRLAHEMNGDWYPWSASGDGESPEDYVEMWQHVVDIFSEKGLEDRQLQWMWSVNNADVGDWSAEDYYPGDDYVDWVGTSAYNFGEDFYWADWSTPYEKFDPVVSMLRELTDKPISVTEYASTSMTEEGNSVTAKSEWITDAFDYFLEEDIDMAIWFNTDKESDWAIFGGENGDELFISAAGLEYNAYSAYRIGVSADDVISSADEYWALVSVNSAVPTPEPSAWLLLISGLIGLAGLKKLPSVKRRALF